MGPIQKPAMPQRASRMRPGDFVLLLYRRKYLILLAVIVTAISVLVGVLLKPTVYRASALVEVDVPPRSASQAGTHGNPQADAGPTAVRDLIEKAGNPYFAWEALREHGLLPAADKWVVSRATRRPPASPDLRAAEQLISPSDRVYWTVAFLSQLSVYPHPEADGVICVNFLSADRVWGASAANAVAKKMAFETHEVVASEEHKRLMEIENRIDGLHREIETIENEVAADGMIRDISSSYDRVTDLVEHLRTAEATLVEAEVAYKTFIQPDGSPNSETITSEELQRLRKTWGEVETEWGDVSERYRRRHPKYIALKNRRDVLSAKIRAEENRIAEETKARYQHARAELKKLEEQHSRLTTQIARMEKDLDSLAKHEAELKSLYAERESLLTQNPRAIVRAGTRQVIPREGVRVREWAVPPESPLNKAIASVLSLSLLISSAVALCVALLLEYYDNSLREPDRVARAAGIAPAMLIPSLKVAKPFLLDRITFDLPDSPAAKAFLALNAMLAPVLTGRRASSIAVSSTRAGEGKTTVAVNLAITQARMSKRVVLVDANLNHPGIHQIFGRPEIHGLTSVLDGSKQLEAIIQRTDIHDLYLVSAGVPARGVANLVAGGKMRDMLDTLRNTFDVIVVDTPGSLVSTDAASVAGMVDGSLFILQSGIPESTEVRMAVKRILSSGGRIVAVVMNRVEPYKVKMHGRTQSRLPKPDPVEYPRPLRAWT